MKRKICLLLIVTLLLTFAQFTASFADGTVNVTINGEPVSFDVQPFIISGRTMIPARAVFESMGAKVFWDPDNNGGYVSIVMPDTSVVIYASSSSDIQYLIKDNGRRISLDAPATIKQGRTFVPLRAITEALNAKVDWNGETKTAAVTNEQDSMNILSDATAKLDSEFTYSEASKAIKAVYSEADISPVPKYNNGVKYYDVIDADSQIKYISSADGTLKKEEYKIYCTINGTPVPYDEYDYYYKIFTERMSDGGANELTEEQLKEAAEKAKNELLNLRVPAEEAKNKGIVIDKNFVDVSSYFRQMMTYGFSDADFCKMTGISLDTLNSFIDMYTYRNSLIEKLIAEGEVDISKEAQEKKFKDDFYKAKHILFKTTDDEGKPLSDDKIKAKKKLAEDTLKKIKSGSDFDKLMNDLSDDPGKTAYPEGYVFTSGEMIAEFENAVKSLEFDKISDIIESSYGFHIIKRIALNPENEKDTIETYSSALQNGLINDYIVEVIPKWQETMKINIL